jgi:hypothetical protein
MVSHSSSYPYARPGMTYCDEWKVRRWIKPRITIPCGRRSAIRGLRTRTDRPARCTAVAPLNASGGLAVQPYRPHKGAVCKTVGFWRAVGGPRRGLLPNRAIMRTRRRLSSTPRPTPAPRPLSSEVGRTPRSDIWHATSGLASLIWRTSACPKVLPGRSANRTHTRPNVAGLFRSS